MKKKGLRADKEIRSDESREVPMAALPAAFLARMRELLGDEYEAFVRSYEQPRTQGLRLNPLKVDLSGSVSAGGKYCVSGIEKAAVNTEITEGSDGTEKQPNAAEKLCNSEKLCDAEKIDSAGKPCAADKTDITQRLTEIFGLRKIPWARDGYYYDAETRPGRHPYHEAGLYYIQEPSAMAVAELLDPQPGERILDLCAAPGGKTTQIAARMMGRGLLVSNEIHPARAKILSQNVERIGAGNVVVTNEEPSRLAEYFPEYFDRILVDAPCSGEGMFRKDEMARREWSPDNVKLCARRQAEILEQAARMLKAGGRLVYSTCTFAPEEDEGTIQGFLDRHDEYMVEKVSAYAGFSPGRPEWVDGGQEELRNTFRIWPHKVDGEGHYAAVLSHASSIGKKKRSVQSDGIERKNKTMLSKPSSGSIGEEIWDVWRQFREDTYLDFPAEVSEEEMRRRMILYGEQLYLLPEEIRGLDGLRVLRPGLHLGTVRKNRFEPSHALALCSSGRNVIRQYDMSGTGEEILKYLRGELISVLLLANKLRADELQMDKFSSGKYSSGEIQSDEAPNGWTLITVDGFSIGWGKRVGDAIKNHYPKGLRRDI